MSAPDRDPEGHHGAGLAVHLAVHVQRGGPSARGTSEGILEDRGNIASSRSH